MTEERPPTTLIVADPHELYVRGLAAAVARASDIALLAATTDGTRAVELIGERSPAVAIIALEFSPGDGRELTSRAHVRSRSTQILLLADRPPGADVLQVLTEGAAGFVSRSLSATEMIDAIRRAAAGESLLPADIGSDLAATLRGTAESAGAVLSPHEIEVLQRMARGESAIAIAAALELPLATVRSQIHSIYTKLGVHDRGAAVASAIRRGLMP